MFRNKPHLLLVFGFAAGLLLILLVGSLRYGGVGGLYLRVRAELPIVEAEVFAPTPLPTPTRLATVVPPPPATVLVPSATPTLSPTPMASATATTTSTPLPTETPSPTPTPLYAPAAPAVELAGLRHEWQTWNNCGPASLSMYLSYYGLKVMQGDVAAMIHPDKDDKHVGMPQLAAYAQTQGFEAISRVNGTAETLKLLLSNGLPVMAPTWHVDAKGTGMGHYRLITGYDDALGEWILYDSLESRGISKDKPYPGVRLGYQEMEDWWQVMNYAYFVVYQPEQAPLVEAIIGDQMDDSVMWSASLERARGRVEQRPEDAFAWFTLGTNLVGVDRYEEAAAAYDRARVIGLPFRMMWYQFGPFKAYYEIGRLEEVVALADATIKLTEMGEELHYWRGRALAGLGDTAGARLALEKALAQRPAFPEAEAALQALGQ